MDVRGNIVKLSDGTQISYDKCLIATGMLLIFFSLFFVLCQAFYFSGIYLIKFLQYVSNTWQSSHVKDSHTDNHAIGFFTCVVSASFFGMFKVLPCENQQGRRKR